MKSKNLIPFFCVALAGLVVGGLTVLKYGENRLNAKSSASNANLPVNPSLAPMWDAPAFALTDQEGRPVTERDMRGHIWVSDFIFTQCAGNCPAMTHKMAQLQAKLGDSNIKFVSFSVDPEHDTPQNLKAYGAQYGADFSRWSFLSSPSRATIWAVAKGMKITGEQQDAQDELLHSNRFLLTDGQGQVRGVYDSDDEKSLKQLAADAVKLSH